MKRSGIFQLLMLIMGVSVGFFLRGHFHERVNGLNAWTDSLSFYQASLPDGEWQWHSAATLLLGLFLILAGWVLRSLSNRSRCLLAGAILWSISAVSIGLLTYFPAERKVPIYLTESSELGNPPPSEASSRYLSDRRYTQFAWLGLCTFYAGGVLVVVHAWRSKNPNLNLIRLQAAGLLALSFMLLFAYVMIPSPPGGFIQRSGIMLGVAFVVVCLYNWMRLSDYSFLREFEAQEKFEVPTSIGLRANEILDGYRLLRPLGQGGFGEVWLCRCGVLRDFKALKFIAGNEQEKLEKELAALRSYKSAVGHWHGDHLIPIHHVGQNDKGLFYVMPLADGFGHDDPRDERWMPYTLANMVEARKSQGTWFDADLVVKVMVQILEALTSLNRAELMHRDVKPDNVLFIRGKVCLADVSLVRSDSRTTYTRIGALNYMAPEWYNGHPDMYGVAMTMYYFITGHSPELVGRAKFVWPNCDSSKIREEDREIWNFFHHHIILRATSDIPEERFRDFSDMAQALLEKMQSRHYESIRGFAKGRILSAKVRLPKVIGSTPHLHQRMMQKRRMIMPRLKHTLAELSHNSLTKKTPERGIKKLVQISQRLKTRTRDKGRGE